MQLGSFKDINRYLAGFIPKQGVESVYNLDRIKSLMGYLGNPQNKLKVIHVAGTSGKTSTSYFIASLLTKAGYKVGLSISPHLEEINERLQIGLTPLEEKAYVGAFNEFNELVVKSQIKPTYFELLVALAYWYFHKIKVDFAVIEVGLGGLLDGTNVIDNPDKICVITDIGLDHTHILGDTVELIAAQKAGIIHSGNQVLMNQQPDQIINVIQGRTNKVGAGLTIVRPNNGTGLRGYQARNFDLALATVQSLLSRENLPSLTEDQINHASEIVIPGRMEIYRVGNKTVILDGAHNAQKFEALGQSLKQQYKDKAILAIVGFAAHSVHRLSPSLKKLNDVTPSIILTEFSGEDTDMPHQSMSVSQMESAMLEAGMKPINHFKSPDKALEYSLAQPQPVILVTGSLYLLSSAKAAIKNLANKI